MDHHEQHHQHHEKERQEKIKQQKEHEREQEQTVPVIHPGWFLAVGVFLILLVVLLWTVLG